MHKGTLMLISVVIPLYNKEKDIVTTLRSVMCQTFTDFEVIVVNDGSTDNSETVLTDFLSSFDEGDRILSEAVVKVKVINKPNGGVCSARNRGIEEAKGEYVALRDADDVWDKDYLQEQVSMIADFPQAAMWGINYAEVYEGKLIRRLHTGLADGFRGYVDDYFSMKNRQSDLFCSSSVVIRRSVFDVVGLFDERLRYSEDIDMWFRIIATHKVAFYDRYMVYYRYDASNRAMNGIRTLRYWLPYYSDKYKASLYRSNSSFYLWIMRWCAVSIKRVYFSDSRQRTDAIDAVKRLDFSVLPFKYRLFFGLPYRWAAKLYQWDEKRLNNK